jgi:hypothetical protein
MRRPASGREIPQSRSAALHQPGFSSREVGSCIEPDAGIAIPDDEYLLRPCNPWPNRSACSSGDTRPTRQFPVFDRRDAALSRHAAAFHPVQARGHRTAGPSTSICRSHLRRRCANAGRTPGTSSNVPMTRCSSRNTLACVRAPAGLSRNGCDRAARPARPSVRLHSIPPGSALHDDAARSFGLLVPHSTSTPPSSLARCVVPAGASAQRCVLSAHAVRGVAVRCSARRNARRDAASSPFNASSSSRTSGCRTSARASRMRRRWP